MTSSARKTDEELLALACETLGLVDGCLLSASKGPVENNEAHWTDKGDWLALAHQLDAQSLFFVGQEPLLVLASLPDGMDEGQFFNRVWCMARPQLLLLARAGELAVYQLTTPPIRSGEKLDAGDRLLALAQSAAEIQTKLFAFARESLESGTVYGDERFKAGGDRADRALVRDLRTVRRLLINEGAGLAPAIAHSLIGRSLFVRYLEDRQIITREYFRTVVANREDWRAIVEQDQKEPFAVPGFASVLFFRVLRDKDLTYALFDQLAKDFDGDTFPVSNAEREDVSAEDLSLLRRLLIGDAVSSQQQLFLFAYRFDVIPIELISSIYEEFYTAHRGKGKTQASYYTRPAVVEYLLSQVLSETELDKRPRVLDPACGSGIFLVEAFRRMVRYRTRKQRRRLSPRELRCILRDQIGGIDLNPEAVPVAAFSLYLAYLHYQEPREINDNRRLPNLKWVPERKERQPDQHLDILFSGNAFDAIQTQDSVVQAHFGPDCADIIVGNPPWGEVKKDDPLSQLALPAIIRWCNGNEDRAVGDGELSQTFVHLALEMLRADGKAALLLPSGVLFKQHEKSRRFRKSWLSRCALQQVINFAHVRHLFFTDSDDSRKGAGRESEGVAPFISAIFQKKRPGRRHIFSYWSLKRTIEVEKTRAVVLSRGDMHWLDQIECLRHESLWKIYLWGDRRDETLIRTLERFPSLSDLLLNLNPDCPMGQGYTPGTKSDAPTWLQDLKELPVSGINRYRTPVRSDFQDGPQKVHRPSTNELATGPRLLIRRGIVGKGEIAIRLVSDPFCVRNSVNCFRLDSLTQDEQRLLLGIYLSSLAKYYLWLTAHSWGLWHDELQADVAGSMPIRLDASTPTAKEIIANATALSEDPDQDPKKLKAMEEALDNAVFEHYELNGSDRELVSDMCALKLDFFYNRHESYAVQPVLVPQIKSGVARSLPKKSISGLAAYIKVFLQQWNSDLAPDGELAWEVVEGPATASILAVLFGTVVKGGQPKDFTGARLVAWNDVLVRMQQHSLIPLDSYRSIYIDTFLRAVSEHEILIVKRNERRFWTTSAARDDADATLAQAMRLAERAK